MIVRELLLRIFMQIRISENGINELELSKRIVLRIKYYKRHFRYFIHFFILCAFCANFHFPIFYKYIK